MGYEECGSNSVKVVIRFHAGKSDSFSVRKSAHTACQRVGKRLALWGLPSPLVLA